MAHDEIEEPRTKSLERTASERLQIHRTTTRIRYKLNSSFLTSFRVSTSASQKCLVRMRAFYACRYAHPRQSRLVSPFDPVFVSMSVQGHRPPPPSPATLIMHLHPIVPPSSIFLYIQHNPSVTYPNTYILNTLPLLRHFALAFHFGHDWSTPLYQYYSRPASPSHRTSLFVVRSCTLSCIYRSLW